MSLVARALAAALLAALAVQAAARAQAPVTRVPHTGRVVDQAKKPVAGAKVTFVSEGSHCGLDEGDVVRVDADAEGRFRAQLQPTRSYVAWATTARGDGFAVSDPVEVGTLPLELIAGTVRAETRLRIAGCEPWRELGPLRVEVLLFGGALAIRGEPDGDGAIDVPPLPDVVGELRVFAKDVFVHVTPSNARGTIDLPKPRRLRVRVADENGRPIAKAVVQRLSWRQPARTFPFQSPPDASAHPVATTADDGSAEVLLALDVDPFESSGQTVHLRALHDGHASGSSGFASRPFVNDQFVDPEKAGGVLPFVLATSSAPPIRVLAPEGRMPPVVQCVGYREVPHRAGRTMALYECERAAVRDGVLHLARVGDPALARRDDNLTIELSYEAVLPANDAWQRSSRPMPLVLPRSALAAGELDLRTVVPLRVQVLDTQGGPAIGAHVVCCPESGHAFVQPAFAMQARCDRTGRIVLPVLPGRWFVIAALPDGIAHAAVEAAPGLGPQTVQLRGFARMRVRVVDGDGKAVEGARFAMFGWGWNTAGTPEEEILRHASWALSTWIMQRVQSDADGNLDVPFFDAPRIELRAQGTKEGRAATELRLVANDDRVDVVLK